MFDAICCTLLTCSTSGPHSFHNRPSVFQSEAAGECHVGLQTPPDGREQPAGHAAGGLPQGVPVCVQGEWPGVVKEKYLPQGVPVCVQGE